MFKRFGLLSLTILLVAACRTSVSQAPIATTNATSSPQMPAPTAVNAIYPLPTTLPNGWTVYTNNLDGFALALPPQWGEIDLDPELLDASLKQMVEQNPSAANTISDQEVQQAAKAGMKLMAFDFSSLGQESVYSGATITKLKLPFSTSLDEVVSELLKRQEKMDTVVKPIQHERVRLNVGEAEKMSYIRNINTEGQQVQLYNLQYIILRDDVIYILSMNTPAKYLQDYAEIFKQIADNFQLVK